MGRALLARLAREPDVRVVALARAIPAGAPDPDPDPDNGDPERLRWVRGDLEQPAAWAGELAGAEAVLHLAATTGKARGEVYERVNVQGTRALLEAARAAGVERFLLVSTIAATYPDLRHYPYARSKAAAEELVRAGDRAWTIARPTIVLGPDAPAWRNLSGLASKPLVPVFGDGRTPIQPVWVDDVAGALARVALDGRFRGEAFDLGGPDALSFEDFLRRAHRALRGGEARVLHLPVRAAIAVLARVEGPLLPVLPVTAGQLTAFVADGSVRAAPPAEIAGELRTGVDRMLALLSSDDAGRG